MPKKNVHILFLGPLLTFSKSSLGLQVGFMLPLEAARAKELLCPERRHRVTSTGQVGLAEAICCGLSLPCGCHGRHHSEEGSKQFPRTPR